MCFFMLLGRPPPRPPHQTSRTQLKQQLQRQQLEQEERRERERMSQVLQPSSGNICGSNSVKSDQWPPSIPSHSAKDSPKEASKSMAIPDPPAVAVPSQVLQVKTRLENPTLYHVIQSQKRQVRQFLQGVHSGTVSASLGDLSHNHSTESGDHGQELQQASAPAGGFAVPSTQPLHQAEVGNRKHF